MSPVRNLLWILAVALLAFQLGFKPLAIAREHTRGAGVATYSFPTEDLLVAVGGARQTGRGGERNRIRRPPLSQRQRSPAPESEAATESEAGDRRRLRSRLAGLSDCRVGKRRPKRRSFLPSTR